MGRRAPGPLALTLDQECELIAGPDLAGAMALGEGRGRPSQFDSKAARAEAWKVHRPRLCEQAAERKPGSRPWMFWHAAGREELIDAEFERVRFLIDGGHLDDAEAAELVEEGKQARARVGTDAEQYSEEPDDEAYDRLAARIGELVEASRGD